MSNNLYTSWRDDVAQSIYPFAGFVSPALTDGEELPDGVILDALLHAVNSPGGYYLDSLVITGSDVEFFIYDSTRFLVARGTWTPDLPDTSTVPLFSDAGDNAGVLVVGPDTLRSFVRKRAEGTYLFEDTTTGFAPSTWLYAKQEISDIRALDGVVVPSEGDLYLVGASGIRLECDGNVVTVNAIGDPLAKRRECGEEFQPPRYITEIVYQNGDVTKTCGPGDYGEAHLIADSPITGFEPALRIVNQPNKIQLGLFAP